MTRRGPTKLIQSLPAAAWRIALALAMVWASLLMVTPSAQATGMEMPMHHAMTATDVHDMSGSSHQECVVCALCGSLAVAAAPVRLTLGNDTLKPMALLTLAGLDRSPDQRPPIATL